MASIHPTAIVDAKAEIGQNVVIGPFCTVGSHVTLNDNVILHSHVCVTGRTSVGANSVIHPFSVIGGNPQHLAFRDEETQLVIGENNVIREHVTMHIGTAGGGGITRIGANGYFMVGAHIAHDCTVGDSVIFANNATLGGHVIVEQGAFLGGLSAIHQHCRIGRYAFVGGCAAVAGDIIPFGSAYGNHARLGGLNIIGMKRRNTSRETIHAIRAAYKTLFEEGATFADRLESVRANHGTIDEVKKIVDFIDAGNARSLMTPTR